MTTPVDRRGHLHIRQGVSLTALIEVTRMCVRRVEGTRQKRERPLLEIDFYVLGF